MKYNAQGMRIQKDEATYMTNYFYNSQNRLSGIDVHGTILYFYYDADGNVTAFNHNGGMYYYVKNVQGDIIRIINEGGTTLVTYTYDAWGNIIKQTDATNYNLANVNPFKYRSYVYDYETGLYYLNSRYYDPTTGRFLNADIYCDTMSSVLGTNMFTYCNNNPVNQIDPNGTDAMWLQFPDGANGFGHTSLLLQDATGTWWYFYWGPKQALLRPCGKDDFSAAELNSYLSGFDPRPHHNYYVYATNVFVDSEDINGIGDYALKCHDGMIKANKNDSGDGIIRFYGNFATSFKYAKNLLESLYSNSNATQLYQTIYENGKKRTMYHVCLKVIHFNKTESIANPDEGDLYIPMGYYYDDITLRKNCRSSCKVYDLFNYNCVQSSMDILLKGSFNSKSKKYQKIIEREKSNCHPNKIFNMLNNV